MPRASTRPKLRINRWPCLLVLARDVGAFTDGPGQVVHWAGRGKFDLDVSCLGEKVCRRFSEQEEFDATDARDQVAAFPGDFNGIVIPGIRVEERIGEGEFLLAGLTQLARPNIAKPDGVSMVLERNWLLFGMGLVRGALEPTGRAGQL